MAMMISQLVMFTGTLTQTLEFLNLDTPTLCLVIFSTTFSTIMSLSPYITFLFIFSESIAKLCGWCETLYEILNTDNFDEGMHLA